MESLVTSTPQNIKRTQWPLLPDTVQSFPISLEVWFSILEAQKPVWSKETKLGCGREASCSKHLKDSVYQQLGRDVSPIRDGTKITDKISESHLVKKKGSEVQTFSQPFKAFQRGGGEVTKVLTHYFGQETSQQFGNFQHYPILPHPALPNLCNAS